MSLVELEEEDDEDDVEGEGGRENEILEPLQP